MMLFFIQIICVTCLTLSEMVYTHKGVFDKDEISVEILDTSDTVSELSSILLLSRNAASE